MNKIFFCLSMLLLASISSAKGQTAENLLCLQVRVVDSGMPHKPVQRTPIAIPSVSIEGYNLIFLDSCDGCTLQLINKNGDVEYSIVVPTETSSIVFPFYLSGKYEIQLICGQLCFYSYVEF